MSIFAGSVRLIFRTEQDSSAPQHKPPYERQFGISQQRMKETQADAIMTGRDEGTATLVRIGDTYMPAIILGVLVWLGMVSARSVLERHAAATKLALAKTRGAAAACDL